MEKSILIVEPTSELRFMGPFTGSSATSYILLTNPLNRKVYFKIKTTAPKRYCVRPNSGYVRPKKSLQIVVTLQPFDFDPTEKNKHKFMVQAIVAPDFDDDEEFCDVWRDPNPLDIMESKLKCIFENPVTYAASEKPEKFEPEVNENNDKMKAIEYINSAPKILGEAEEKLLKAAQEVNQLRVEESTLRQENLQLKEDLLKLQNAGEGYDASFIVARGLTSQNSSQLYPNLNRILVAIAMVILGYLLAKIF
ncbi:VAMP-associated protein 33kDa [Ptiloglossa arizonensis]|uniref:VAMP-associated protein 33kDa n=1 Tax=Ptiloglossa arizonensis TaxID=3350558 RepID=UPI003F9FEBFB